ncbi:hypothetical protein ONZ45_g8725 [Pleurotus djamor]|nr:hypothetical protein ONZ45_g8725 [Pleurotus djamor]
MYSSTSDTSSDRLSSTSSTTPPPSPTKSRQRPQSQSIVTIGDEPSALVGKVLRSVKRSPKHPVITMDFTDNTSYQIRIDGYDPQHPGVPKELEMDDTFFDLLNLPNGKLPVPSLVSNCAFVTLTDKAFERKQISGSSKYQESGWEQNHLGLALKLAGDFPRWLCVWATMSDHDPSSRNCIFRNYSDVYLQKLHRQRPHRPSHQRKPSSARS